MGAALEWLHGKEKIQMRHGRARRNWRMNKALYLLPIVTLLTLCWMHYSQFMYPEKPQLITRVTPDFDLKEVFLYGDAQKRVTNAVFPKQPVLINIFASWCSTCIVEHKNLIELSTKYNIPIYGLAYRDNEADIKRFLSGGNNNPYRKIAVDPDGGELLKWNFNGLPQTYLIDANGHIRYHHSQWISSEDVHNIILPLMEQIKN